MVWDYTGGLRRPSDTDACIRKGFKRCGCLKGTTCNCVWYSTQAAGSDKVEEEEEQPRIKVTYKMYPVAKYNQRIIQIRNVRAAVKRFAPRRLQRFS